MTALIIILSIITVIAVLLICPVCIRFKYTQSPFLTVRYLFLSFRILPPKPKKKKTKSKAKPQQTDKKPTAKKEKKPSFIKKIIDKKGLGGFLYIVREVASFTSGELKSLFSHVKIYGVDVEISLSCEDAAQTAVNYGKTCAVVYPAFSVIAENTRCEKYYINIKPNFKENSETEIFAVANARISLFWLIKSAIGAIIKGTKLYLKLKTSY